MNRIFGFFSVIMLAILIPATVLGQSSSLPPPNPEQLSRHQLSSLIATAKTPAEHRRIAQYYQAKSVDYLSQAKEHEQMLAAYRANTTLSTDKNWASTIGHCEYFVQAFKDMSAKSKELAQLHEGMAQDAEVK